LAYRALEAFMDAEEDEQEKDVRELGQLAARLTAVRAVSQQVKDEGDADEDMEKLLVLLEKLQPVAEGSAVADAKLPDGWSQVSGAERGSWGQGEQRRVCWTCRCLPTWQHSGAILEGCRSQSWLASMP
jgi:hypothetical protein